MTIQTDIPNPNGDGTLLTTDDLHRLGWDQATLRVFDDDDNCLRLDFTYEAIHHRDGCRGQHSEIRISTKVGDVPDLELARFKYLCGTCRRMLAGTGIGGISSR